MTAALANFWWRNQTASIPPVARYFTLPPRSRGKRRRWLPAERDVGDKCADEEMTYVSQAEPSRRTRLLGIVVGLGVAQVVVPRMRDIGLAHWKTMPECRFLSK